MSQKPDRLPPNSPEAERGVIGCCLLDPNCIDDCQAKFKPGSIVFYDLRYRKIYEAMCELHAKNEPVDAITLQVNLKAKNLFEEVGGFAMFAACEGEVPSAANLPYYTEIVYEKYQLARLVRTCTKAIETVYNSPEAEASTTIGKIQNGFFELYPDDTDSSDGSACALGLVEDLEKRHQLHSEGKHSGLITGLQGFDHYTDGLQFGEFSVIAARPSVGKTAIGLSILNRVCLQDSVPTLFITLEMSRDALMRRLCSAHCSIPMGSIRHGEFTPEQHTQFASFAGNTLRHRPIYIHDGVKGMNIEQVSAVVRRHVRKHGVKLVIGDYLQRVKSIGKHEKRTYEVGEVSGTLKALADETKTAQLWLCRVNREPEGNKKNPNSSSPPKMHHLSDSGQIEYDSDLIALLHRDKFGNEPNKATLYVAKQRDGELGLVDLEFVGKFCRFENPPIQLPS